MSEKFNKANDWYISNFNSFETKLNGNSNSLLNEIRGNSIKKLSKTNFPTLKDENWKYTNIQPILNREFVHSITTDTPKLTSEDIKNKIVCSVEHHLLVFINGIFSDEFSDVNELPKDVFVGSIKNAIQSKHDVVLAHLNKLSENNANAFDLLNSSYALDGTAIIIPDGHILDKPIQVLYVNSSKKNLLFNTPRNLILAGKNSQSSIIINYTGTDDSEYFSNIVTEVFVDINATVDLYKLEMESNNAYHVERTEVYQKQDSIFSHYNFCFGGKLVRNDINISLNGENCECNLNGLYIGGEDQHFDNHTFIDHTKPNCNSNELYKGILDDKAHGVFNGQIMVRPDAQKTNAYQSNKTILLSDAAVIDTKPQLEIYADDVKCSHGATVGQLDETAYFYILSRGIPGNIAKSMLIRAFANDVIEKVKIDQLRESLNHMIFEQLHRVEI